MGKKIFLVAGEPSGDLHASKLAKEIKLLDPSVKLMGIGGPKMLNAGVELLYGIDDLAIVGVSDIIKNFNRIKSVFQGFVLRVLKEQPDLVILVDYPGFNLKLAQILKTRGIKVLYYISPQIWAWGIWRINKIKRFVDKILVLFNFESKIYEEAGVSVEFVGHPLMDIAKPSLKKEEILKKLGLDRQKRTVILLPGSRRREIDFLLPVMIKSAAALYKKSKDLQFIIVKSHNLDEAIFKKYLNKFDAPHALAEHYESELYDYLSIADLAIAASGTVTLECAIMNVPMVIIYKISFVNALIIKPFVRVPNIGLVNVLAGKRIVPELVQSKLTVKNLYNESSDILFNIDRSRRIKNDLKKIRDMLGGPGASLRAAKSVIKFI